ncbi:MAG TPA: tetraacyldisaccharide 4'-kinase [Bacteroidales bacterium]|nr:tetraacyldisaccharide 4'-kinase [Bacteroidales bacterium]
MRRLLLFPFSLIYGFVIRLRNWLYDKGFFKPEGFDMPVISVGNLSTGGTGKTPQIEYLIRLLSGKYQVAMLSRGYGRKTKGFVAADKYSTALEIGDEPAQIANKFENVHVCVDEDRVHGIRELTYRYPNVEVILLDDAFQHRAVKPGLSLLLTDFYHLYSEDFLLPSGNLREPRSAAKRADIIIVTKSRNVFSPITYQRLTESLQPHPHQRLFLSYIKYGQITPLNKKECALRKGKTVNTIFMFAGIANTYPLEDYLKGHCVELVTLIFPDHHRYTQKDITKIRNTWDDIFTKNKLMVTTEKDVMRLKNPDIWDLVVNLPIHYVPIEVGFHNQGKKTFDRQILDYVEKSKRNH